MLEIGVLFVYMFLFTTLQVFLVGTNIKRIQSYHIGVWLSILIASPTLGALWEMQELVYIILPEHFWIIFKIAMIVMSVVCFIQWQIHNHKKCGILLGFLGGLGAVLMAMMNSLIQYPFYQYIPQEKWSTITFYVWVVFCIIQVVLCQKKVATIFRWILPAQLMFASVNMLFCCGMIYGEWVTHPVSNTGATSGGLASMDASPSIVIMILLVYFWYFWIPGCFTMIYGLRSLKKVKKRIWVNPKEKDYLAVSKKKTVVVALGVVVMSLSLFRGDLTLFLARDYQLEGYTVIAYNGDGGSIKIPKGVTHIKNGVFDGKNIEKVSFPNTLTYIGAGAFQNNQITEIKLQDSIEIIEENAFRNNEIVSVKVSDENVYIEGSAFLGNPCSVEIENDAPMYAYTTELVEVSEDLEEALPENTEIVNDVFLVQDGTILLEYLGKDPVVEIPYGITEIGKEAFAYIPLDTVLIPNTVKIIGEWAFNQTWLTEIEIPEGVEVIEMNAFSGCDFTELVLPDSLLEIGDDAFSYMDLEKIHFGNQLRVIGASAFKGAFEGVTSITLPDSIEEIGNWSFAQNPLIEVILPEKDIALSATIFAETPWYDEMTEEFAIVGDGILIKYNGTDQKITIPDGVRCVGGRVFKMHELTEVILPSTLEHIGEQAFSDNELEEVIFPEGLLTIGYGAFFENHIQKLDLPDTVTEIGNSAFSYNQITTVQLPSTLDQIADDAFFRNSIEELELPDTIQSIGESAFAENKIVHLALPDFVETIGESAFRDNQITQLQLSENLQKIERKAFANNQILQLMIPDSVGCIDEYAFAYNQIAKVQLPEGLQEIGNYAFANNQIAEFTLPDGIQNLGMEILSENPWEINQKSEFVVLGDGILYQYLGNDKMVVVPEGIKKIGKYAFAEIEESYSVVLPDSVTVIDGNAFFASGLTNIHMSKNIKEIGAFAFYNTNLRFLTLYYDIEMVDDNIWLNCPDGGTVVIQYTADNQTIKEQFVTLHERYEHIPLYLEKVEEVF
ncbi:leucine-rich repeat domain-containing protein [Chakrabartyella piscis]|uniref:leucine-rich repeat domain-containing protein n=1 Tax=Chakrabartyella piscis TaxID=2918914 RepID=UPI002958CD1C|nr:leucine-rich repeat domain-containing protein [Chakrabartyella piscis]